MRRIQFLVIFIVFGISLFADNKGTYLSLLKDNKLAELENFLQSWEKQDSKNPELYIAYFNYHLRKGSKSGISIDNFIKDPTKETLSISDPKTGNIVGYLNDTIFYDFDEVNTALHYLDLGLEFGPNRLDIYFGKISTLGKIGEYGKQSQQLIETLRHGLKINNAWLWSDNKPIPDGKSVLLNATDDYYGLWFKTKTDVSLQAAYNAAIEQSKLFPDHNYAYNDLGTYFAIKKQYTDAISYFRKAEDLVPQDIVVISNIARCYEDSNNVPMAIASYEKILKYGNKNEIDYAKSKIKKLQQ